MQHKGNESSCNYPNITAKYLGGQVKIAGRWGWGYYKKPMKVHMCYL